MRAAPPGRCRGIRESRARRPSSSATRGGRRNGRTAAVIQESLCDRPCLYATLARQELVQDEAERVQIAPDSRVPSRQLLGCHVSRYAGEYGFVADFVRNGRDAEVGHAGAAVAVNHHVGGFEIAMQDARVVRRRQPAQIWRASSMALSEGSRQSGAGATPGPRRR
jgi:hypothetical protein